MKRERTAKETTHTHCLEFLCFHTSNELDSRKWRQNGIFCFRRDKNWSFWTSNKAATAEKNAMPYAFLGKLYVYVWKLHLHFLHPEQQQKIVRKLNLVYEMCRFAALSSIVFIVASLLSPLLALFFFLFSKKEKRGTSLVWKSKFQIIYTYIRLSHGWKCYPCQYIKWNICIHTRFSFFMHFFFWCRRSVFLLPFFRSKIQIDIGWRRTAAEKNTLKFKRGLFFLQRWKLFFFLVRLYFHIKLVCSDVTVKVFCITLKSAYDEPILITKHVHAHLCSYFFLNYPAWFVEQSNE